MENENCEVKLSENAKKVLEKRYLKKDINGNPTETPRELFERVAYTIANADANFGADETEINKTKKKFYNMDLQECVNEIIDYIQPKENIYDEER